MFRNAREEYRTQVCPELKEKGKCRVSTCIYMHPQALVEAAAARAASKEPPAKHRTVFAAAPRPGAKIIDPAKVSKSRPSSRSQAPSNTKFSANFVPIDVPNPPVVYNYRAQMLKAIKDRLDANGSSNSKALAMKLELKTVKESTESTYAQNIRNVVKAINRGDYKDGAQEAKAKAEKAAQLQKLRDGLPKFVIPLSKLSDKFITEIPVASTIDKAERLSCDRCKAEVTLETIETLAQTPDNAPRCTFHPVRRQWDPKTKKLSEIYPCCGLPRDQSNGCETQHNHVLKFGEPEKMHAMVPFVHTRSEKTEKTLFAAAIDCEMAYTTRGMELIRVSALDWDTNKVVMDRTVFPYGKIIDLNTRWSGVSDIEEGTTVNGKHLPTISFNEARMELFKWVNNDTIIVGHGLENDLNTLRLVHHKIVDTAMSYPPNRTRTYALKQLAWTYLSRQIQSGEHDSFEDALTAMDIVKADILKTHAFANHI